MVIPRLCVTQEQRGLCSQSGILLETLNTQKSSSKLGRSEKTVVSLAAVWKTRLGVEMRMKRWCLYPNCKWWAVVSLSTGRHPGSIKFRWNNPHETFELREDGGQLVWLLASKFWRKCVLMGNNLYNFSPVTYTYGEIHKEFFWIFFYNLKSH